MKALLVLSLVLACSSSSFGQTLYVNGGCGDDSWSGLSPTCVAPDGPKRTIQAAIPSSGSANVIVAAGVYAEQISISRIGGDPPWTISIESETGPASTIIDGVGDDAVSANNLGNRGHLIVRGFTVQNGFPGISQGTRLDLDVQNCIFVNCGDGMSIRDVATISGCVFRDNTGHGVHLVPGFSAEADLDHCIFRDNAGAAIHAQRASATLVNALVAFNGSPTQPALFGTEGGGLTLKNVTVVANNGPGIYVTGSSSRAARLNAHNTIVWGNNAAGTQIVVIPGGPFSPQLDVQYSIVQGGYAGTANLSSDPLFVNAGAADFHLGAGSPAIDSGYAFLVPGDQNIDLDGQQRFQDDPAAANIGAPFPTYLDRGAYEAAGRPYCVGDTDDDHDVDLADLTLLLSQFGSSGAALPGDQNRNGIVDLEDLATLLSNYGVACP